MSDEVRVTSGLQIIADPIREVTQPSTFTADMDGRFGPTPGCVNVPTYGLDIDLSALTTPGFCRIQNLDDENFVEYGIREPATGYFYPVGEVGPGEVYVLKLSRNIMEQYENTGTGTSAPTNYWHFKANGSACAVRVEVWER